MQPVGVFDSITRVPADAVDIVVVCGSHGGVYAAHEALMRGVRGVIFNDAGIGLHAAGVRGLHYLDGFGIPAAAVSHQSARIGDGTDMMTRGMISRVNESARRFGCRVGLSCAACAAALCQASVAPVRPLPTLNEARQVFRGPSGETVVVLDSNSLVRPEDRSAVVITGSHGGLLGGNPRTAIKFPVRAAAYNDAGIGIDQAGISRLPALDVMGVAGFTVSSETAEIGSGLSTLNDGVVSAVNEIGFTLGVRVGSTARTVVLTILGQAQMPGVSWLPPGDRPESA